MYKIAVLKGDGIGPEIVDESLKVLDYISNRFEFSYEINEANFGGDAIDKEGHPFPETTQHIIDQSDAILLGAVGGPKWENAAVRPEKGLLSLRKYLNAYCNLRPIICFDPLKSMSPIKLDPDKKVDICFVRELTGGIYFGEKGIEESEDTKAYDVEAYTVSEVKRISKRAFDLSQTRDRKVTSVDKSNVLESSKLWRREVITNSQNYDVTLEHMYVDNAAMQLIKNPYQFDVILTNNIFGDILSDEASVLAGSIGVLPSASVGDKKALYEPIHGSAPDIAGEGKANPIGMILSVAMMLENSFNRKDVYHFIYNAIEKTLNDGYGTIDLNLDYIQSTSEWTNQLIETMRQAK